MKDFNFHTAHLKHTISKTLCEALGADGEKAVKLALKDFSDIFGKEYLEALNGIYPE